jgi:histidyl-tRNA synthetase
LPGVGISFGADRIYDVMQTLDLFPKELISDLDVLFLNFGEREMLYILPITQNVRLAGFNAEIYPDAAKLKKQMKYADERKVKFVVIAGEEEINRAQFTVKNMTDGQQQVISLDGLIDFLKENFS